MELEDVLDEEERKIEEASQIGKIFLNSRIGLIHSTGLHAASKDCLLNGTCFYRGTINIVAEKS